MGAISRNTILLVWSFCHITTSLLRKNSWFVVWSGLCHFPFVVYSLAHIVQSVFVPCKDAVPDSAVHH